MRAGRHTHTVKRPSAASVSSFYRLCESGGTLGFTASKQACSDPTMNTCSPPHCEKHPTHSDWKLEEERSLEEGKQVGRQRKSEGEPGRWDEEEEGLVWTLVIVS